MTRAILTLITASALTLAAHAADGELAKIQGKWETKRTNEDGQKVTQTLELKENKMTFKILDSSGSVQFVALADVKAQQSGAFKTFTISNIKAGRDDDSLEGADEERAYVYMLSSDTLTIVSNIDEERERPPTIDVYKKVSSSK